MLIKFDREIFFDSVRDKLFDGALTQQQVDGCGVILGLWEGQYTGTPMSDIRWLAYILATVFHECATTMWPITEYGSQSYLQGKDYWPYIGRGFVMITWEDNYRRASQELSLTGTRDLVEHPELALRFDALRRDREPERLAEAEDGPHHLAPATALVEVGDELPVDLDHVEGEVAQRAQR